MKILRAMKLARKTTNFNVVTRFGRATMKEKRTGES